MKSPRIHHLLPILLLLCVLAGLVSCRPKGILSSREMREVMTELHKTDALIQVSGLHVGHDEVRDLYYAQVLEKHGVTQAQFDSSLVWYTAHPKRFDKIYPKVRAELSAEHQAFRLAHAEGSENKGNSSLPDANTLPAAEPFGPMQLDSLLWVTQHGYPSTWQPLVHNLENQFFPQIGIFR